MESSDKKLPKGVFLLPNALTTAAMFAALWFLPTANLWIGIATGIAVFVLALTLVGGLRLQRNGLPELTI